MQKMGRVILLFVVSFSVTIAIASAIQLIRETSRVHVVRLATGSPSGEYYAFGDAIEQVTEAHFPKIQIEVLKSPGSNQNMEDVQAGRVDMALVQNDTPVQPDVRAVAQLYPEMFHFIVSKDAGIDSIDDLRGKRIALMPEGSGSYALFWPLSQHYGLTPADFQSTPMPAKEAYESLIAGRVDALFRIIGLGNEAIGDLLKTGRFKLVPIAQIGALQLSQPYLQSTMIPRGSYDGAIPEPPQDLPVVAVSALLIAHQDLSPEVVKTISQVLYEYRNELISENPRTARIQSPEASQNLGFPMHPGASAYFNQDEPSFFVQYAEPMGLLLSVSILLFSGVWQFRLWFIGRQKNIADTYNLEILDLIERIEEAQTLQELHEIRQKLFGILKQVVVDLDIDRISPTAFQSFTFPWEVAITTIRHKEFMLKNAQDRLP
ncbi:MAG: TAXI family TRAP transporter solute-binding subunit [Leptolyngbya sp. SIO4C1]|nr:TAXI family TRAP transporter solute-binding subunit [Leptolyngbya sp. SIO4C1]